MQSNGEMDWATWEVARPPHADRIVAQLKKEVGPKHVLFEVLEKLEIIAVNGASDEILLSNPHDPGSAYIVHLTWSTKPEIESFWPATVVVPKGEIPSEFG
ncbi:MAG: hypothetical protein GC186_14280 [Rhodobacteraceae bacterium]|nr:hypothetical protein [Paracoccaceae bacterium]